MAAERKLQPDQIEASGGGLTWQIISTNTTAVAGNGYLVDLSGGPVTLTLPATMNLDDKVGFCDFTGNASTNNLTIARNGNKIMGDAADLVVRTDRSSGELVGSNAAQGWVVDGEVNLTSNAASSAAAAGFLQKLVIECSSASQVVINSGSKVGMDDGSEVVSLGSNITVDITTSGANGLDTGSEAASTWYYIWLIKNPTTGTVAGLLSASSTSPTLPSGYTKKRLIGAVRNDGSSNFLQFKQCDNKVGWFTKQILLSAGSATSYTQLSVSSILPPMTSYWSGYGAHHSNTKQTSFSLSLDGSNDILYDQLEIATLQSDSYALSYITYSFVYTGSIWYKGNSSEPSRSITLYITGFELSI